jgi:Histidine kinase-, DNA gyrase B-, and HSP90-like ATPase
MFLDRAQASDRHLMELVDDVLDLSRLEADRLLVEDVVGNLNVAMEMTVALVDAPARAKRLSLTVRHVGAGEQADVYYRGDDMRVRQILANLLTNSVKFTDPGGRITITTGEAERRPASVVTNGAGPWAYVRVEDTGAGIAADRLTAVFEPFVQADMSRTRRHGGSGLGLAISRRLARLMGGDVIGESIPGKGSTFVLWLRSAPAPAALPRSAVSATSRGASRTSPSAAPPPSDALAAAAAAVLGDIRRVLHAHVARLRSDPLTPSARRVPARMLEDHLGTFLADLAESVASNNPPADPLEAADRHGRQRARLGWTAEEVQREYQILSEELTEAVRRRVAVDAEDAERAVDALRAHLALAEQRSVATFATSTPSSPYQ